MSRQTAKLSVLAPFFDRDDMFERRGGDLVVGHLKYDVDTIVTCRAHGRPHHGSQDTEPPEQHLLDAVWRTMMASIDPALPNRIDQVVSGNLREVLLAIRSYSDVVPPEYYVFNRDAAMLKLLANVRFRRRDRAQPLRVYPSDLS